MVLCVWGGGGGEGEGEGEGGGRNLYYLQENCYNSSKKYSDALKIGRFGHC